MPNPTALLEYVAKIEQVCTKTSMIQVEPVIALCAKLREVVETMTRLDAFTWKFVHDHSHDLTEYRAWESVHYPVEHALTPLRSADA